MHFLTCFLGDFISTKSQNEVIAADVKLEREEHFVHHRELEEKQVWCRIACSASRWLLQSHLTRMTEGAGFLQRNAKDDWKAA